MFFSSCAAGIKYAFFSQIIAGTESGVDMCIPILGEFTVVISQHSHAVGKLIGSAVGNFQRGLFSGLGVNSSGEKIDYTDALPRMGF